jgi:hypothetical protein
MKGFVTTVLSFALVFTHLATGSGPAVARPAPNISNTKTGLHVRANILLARQMAPHTLADHPERTLPDIHKLLRPPIV